MHLRWFGVLCAVFTFGFLWAEELPYDVTYLVTRTATPLASTGSQFRYEYQVYKLGAEQKTLTEETEFFSTEPLDSNRMVVLHDRSGDPIVFAVEEKSHKLFLSQDHDEAIEINGVKSVVGITPYGRDSVLVMTGGHGLISVDIDGVANELTAPNWVQYLPGYRNPASPVKSFQYIGKQRFAMLTDDELLVINLKTPSKPGKDTEVRIKGKKFSNMEVSETISMISDNRLAWVYVKGTDGRYYLLRLDYTSPKTYDAVLVGDKQTDMWLLDIGLSGDLYARMVNDFIAFEWGVTSRKIMESEDAFGVSTLRKLDAGFPKSTRGMHVDMPRSGFDFLCRYFDGKNTISEPSTLAEKEQQVVSKPKPAGPYQSPKGVRRLDPNGEQEFLELIAWELEQLMARASTSRQLSGLGNALPERISFQHFQVLVFQSSTLKQHVEILTSAELKNFGLSNDRGLAVVNGTAVSEISVVDFAKLLARAVDCASTVIG